MGSTYRIEVKDDGRWVPAPGESAGLTLEMAEEMVEAGIPTMDGSEPKWDDVRIVGEE